MAPINTSLLAQAIAGQCANPPRMVDEALALANIGIPVFPCEKGGKRPVGSLVHHGCKDATTDLKRIEHWWSSGDWNIGIATGDGVVLDVDPRHGGHDSLQQLLAVHGPLPLTWISSTGGGGHHFFFRHPSGELIGCPKDGLPSGLDIKGHGGYVIAPHSLHASGRRYEWHSPPCSTPLAPMPSWLVDIIRKAKSLDGAARPASHWEQLVNARVGEGVRNSTLTHITGHLLWSGKVSPHVALEFARLWNRAHCTPPLSDAEVVRVVDSISGRELQKRGVLR